MQGIESIILGVSDAVGLLNQTLEMVYPQMTIVGELVNFRVAKGKWLYFDVRDEYAKLHCFGTVYMLPGPLEDGMMVEVTVAPRLHPQFGFTANLSSVRPVGEGSIVKAASLLQKKLEREGLFAAERKRALPLLPQKIALVTSDESAAYSDFIKIARSRWPLAEIEVYSVLVQGVDAPAQIIEAIALSNLAEQPADVVVITRGGGSADDLAAFNDERVVRAVASSRIPTLAAIGHERDFSLAELAADARASTPSNAAELLLPDKKDFIQNLANKNDWLRQGLIGCIGANSSWIGVRTDVLSAVVDRIFSNKRKAIESSTKALRVLDPAAVLRRGYALARKNGKYIVSAVKAKNEKSFDLSFADGDVSVTISST